MAGIDAEIAELKHEKELREARYKNLSQSTSDKERNDLLSQGMGMSLRYRQTGKQQGKTTAGEKYSEIGFYRQETSWKAKTAVKDDYNDPEKNGYPNIDTIKINSTGDINSDARNYYRTKAKRFELLVDCDEVDHKIYDKDDPECDIIAMKDQEQPFGDRPGDDSFVYAGDAHIRAKNRIIIKAGTEIRLEVGRSSIIINESGIILAARKTTSNIMNSWDTIINMDHRSGLLMFGQHVKIDSGTDFAITEGFGGSIGSSAGVMRISAKDLLAKTFGTFNYIMRGSAVGADMAGNIASMGAGIGGADNSMDAVNSFGTNVRIITGITGGILGDRMAASYSDGVDNIGTIAKLLTLIYSILKLVWMTIELTIPVEKQKKGGRDGLSMAASIFEYGIAMAAFIQISVKNLPAAIHSNTLQLGADASLTVYTKTFHTYHLNSENVDGPLNGVDSGEFKENLKDGLKKFWQETLPKWYVLLGAGIGAGVYAGAIGLTKGFATSKQDEEYREELMAL